MSATQAAVAAPARSGVVARALVALIHAYRLVLSPRLPASCRFEPSCSAYGIEAVRRHGALRGTRLTLWRLARCQPFGSGGYDPVPPDGRPGDGEPSRHNLVGRRTGGAVLTAPSDEGARSC